MKKIELHCHLDGSLSVPYVNQLLGRDASAELVAHGATSLAEYLEKFALPLQLLQTRKNLTEFTRLLALDLVQDDVIYAEIRFCPLLHCTQGLSPREAVEAVLAGLAEVPNLATGLILCMVRNLSDQDNEQIMQLAAEFHGKGVCAVDLAGDEAARPNSECVHLFQKAWSDYGLQMTIHAGEAASCQSVEAVIDAGVRRIGHGVRAIESPWTVQRLADKQITLEVCPTSNIDTGIYVDLAHHPIRQLLDAGVLVTINTDNRTVSGVSLSDEYARLREVHGFTDEDFLRCNLNAAFGSFAPAPLKIQLSRRLLASYSKCRQPS